MEFLCNFIIYGFIGWIIENVLIKIIGIIMMKNTIIKELYV
jgi:uncharacterized membrane protein